MSNFFNLKHFLKYCGRLLRKIGIEVNRFYIIEECLSQFKEILVEPNVHPYKLVSLKLDGLKRLAANPKVDYSEDTMLKMLSSSCTCLCLMHQNDLAGYIWYSLKRVESRYLSFPLSNDEAYIYGARTMNAYKRKGIALYLRNVVYKRLHELNRSKIYSIIHYSNKPSLGLNDKLNAQRSKLYFHISLFNKFKRSIYLKNYRDEGRS